METGLIKKNEVGSSMTMDELARMSNAFATSGMFPDIKSAAQAMVKIQAGQEVGIKPFAAMTGIHIIAGKPIIGAGIIASRIKASGKYDYKIIEMTEKNCSIDFMENGKVTGNSSFSTQDAKNAGTKNIDKFPKNMLFARAISNGCKWFSPDVFDGPVYTPEEFETTEDVNHEELKTDVKLIPIEKKEEKEEPDQEEEMPFTIPGNWYAKMDKCSSKADVLEVYKSHKETIDAHPELQKLLKDTQNSFTKLKTA